MNPHILIISSLYDFSTDLVALSLEQDDVPFVRLNREQLADHRLTLDPLIPMLTIYGPAGTHVVGPDLRAIWFRQPVFLRNTPPIPLSLAEQLERSQWNAFLRGLCVFRHASWMNDPAATYLAESKPYQLYLAALCGFRVPQTLATNDAKRIRQSFSSPFVIKSLDTVLLREGGDCLFTYTTINTGADLYDETVSASPLFAQLALYPKTDIRVTIVGEDAFSVCILSQGHGISGDWRIHPKTDLEYIDFPLDDHTLNCCRKLTQRLGLSFAAIDLVETIEGTFFIEVNPTGEWGWLSTPERRIDHTIASWLANPRRRAD